MIEPSLSLLVDGKVITEAVVFDYEGNYVCYPCLHELLGELAPIARFMIELTRLGICRVLKSYLVITGVSSCNIALIPIPRGKVLVIIVCIKYDVEKVVRDLIDTLAKLLKIREDLAKEIPSLGKSLSISELSGALLLSPDGSIVKGYGSLSISDEVIRKLIRFHNDTYEKFRFRAIKLRLGPDKLLVMAPMIRFLTKKPSYIVLAEVRKNIPVSTIMKFLLRQRSS